MGCGADPGTDAPPAPPPGETPVVVSAPAEPPPTAGERSPPPAWIVTEGGARWLGYSTYCWGAACADYVWASCGDAGVPRIDVRVGETVRFHLGFHPREVHLERGRGAESVELEATRTPAWRVAAPGFVRIFASARPGQGGTDASYVACLHTEDDANGETLSVAEALAAGASGPVVVEGSLWAHGADVRLCEALAESYPPQCPGDHLAVEGLTLADVEDLREASGVLWSERLLRVEGAIEAGTLVATGRGDGDQSSTGRPSSAER